MEEEKDREHADEGRLSGGEQGNLDVPDQETLKPWFMEGSSMHALTKCGGSFDFTGFAGTSIVGATAEESKTGDSEKYGSFKEGLTIMIRLGLQSRCVDR